VRLPVEYYLLSQKKYHEKVVDLKKAAVLAKTRLLSLDVKLLTRVAKKKGYNEDEVRIMVVMQVVQYFNEARFFADDLTLKKLSDLGFGTLFARWFIDFDKIHQQFLQIQSRNIKVDFWYALNQIEFHLKLKFNNEIQLFLMPRKRDDVLMSMISEELIKFKNRRKYSGGAQPKYYNDITDLFISEMVCDFDKTVEKMKSKLPGWLDVSSIDFLIKASKGKSEQTILKELIEQCFDYETKILSKKAFYCNIYDLLKLILQDRNLPDEEAFDERYREKAYRNFSSFQAQILRKIVFPKGRN
jgi:hypothetical protein